MRGIASTVMGFSLTLWLLIMKVFSSNLIYKPWHSQWFMTKEKEDRELKCWSLVELYSRFVDAMDPHKAPRPHLPNSWFKTMWSGVWGVVSSVEIRLWEVMWGSGLPALPYCVLRRRAWLQLQRGAIGVTLFLSMINYSTLLVWSQSSGLMFLV